MKKRFLSAVLAVILCVSLASPAFAAEIGHESAAMQMAANEIESETARMMSSVASQLAAQGQLDMLPIYEEILTTEIEASVKAKYGLASPNSINYESEYGLATAASAQSVSLYFPRGGVVGFESAFHTYVVETYMTPSLFNQYAEENVYGDTSFDSEFGDLIDLFGPTVKAWIYALSIPNAIRIIGNYVACNRILEAGGYAEVMVVSDASGIETSTALLVWDNYPYAVFVPFNDNYVWEAF